MLQREFLCISVYANLNDAIDRVVDMSILIQRYE
jgi:hypothetical protein